MCYSQALISTGNDSIELAARWIFHNRDSIVGPTAKLRVSNIVYYYTVICYCSNVYPVALFTELQVIQILSHYILFL